MKLRSDRRCFERPYPTAAARNRDYERILLSIAICESVDQLGLVQEEYAYEIEVFRMIDPDAPWGYGFPFYSNIMDAIALRGTQVRHEMEFPYETDEQTKR